jgi:single-stranded-DNA-specific exonuclease
MNKRWEVAEACPTDFPASVGLDAPLAQVLWNRGIRDKAEAERFLKPSFDDHVHDPSTFRHMEAAVARIFSALEKGERITVHGDYDADGVTGSTVMITTLREIEKLMTRNVLRESAVDSYIPHRDKEGYGLHKDTVPKLVERDTKLIITVDCGIACVEEIGLARLQSIDTIIVDHHQFGETLPEAHLIHPSVPDETYPFKKLAAVGVAFKLACALAVEARKRGLAISDHWEKWLLDLVAIATVTDMVPLVGENRVLETFGLKVLNKTKRPGLRAIIEAAGLEYGKIDTEAVAFTIGPRINAAGRMDHASVALNLLLAATDEEAKPMMVQLDRLNRDRQEATKKMMAQAEAKLAMNSEQRSDEKVLMLWDVDWSPALVGLVAGKFLDRFSRPTVVVGSHDGRWIGSGRSTAAYDITNAMRLAGEGRLTRVGGHIQACGFSLEDATHLPVIQEQLVRHAAETLNEAALEPVQKIDAEIPLEQVNWPLMEALLNFAPFGEGNPRPTFLSRGCYVAQASTVGAQKNHLRLQLLSPTGRRLPVIGFKLGARLAEATLGTWIDIVYHVDINEWNGRRDVQCRLIDFTSSTVNKEQRAALTDLCSLPTNL